MKKQFIFTPGNLLANLHRIGAWSAYGLASSALQHYFPEAYEEDRSPEPEHEVAMAEKIGCSTWQDLIMKYHNEVGYQAGPAGFNPKAVNEN